MQSPAIPRVVEVTPSRRWNNHRATVRYQCAPAAVGRLHVPGDQELQRGWLQDLSQRGIGLLLRRALPDGAAITLSLKATDSGEVLDVPAKVAHSTQLSNGDFLIGCEFLSPLSNEDLDRLL